MTTINAIVGPSGVGKTTLVRRLHEAGSVYWLRGYTTRPKRDGEANEYQFIRSPEFEVMGTANAFIGTVEYSGYWYGLSQRDVNYAIAQEQPVLVILTMEGVHSLRAAGYDVEVVYIAPPSRDELHERLKARGEVTRYAVWSEQDELQAIRNADVVLVNRDLEQTLCRLMRVIGVDENLRFFNRREPTAAEVEYAKGLKP